MDKNSSIVLYDGYCNLCSGTVQFLIKKDRKKRLHFIPLQSPVAGKYITNQNTDFQTVIFVEGEKVYTRSEAILRILKRLGPPWNLFWSLKIVPRFIRDRIYSFIAKKRYLWFGTRDKCFLPDQERSDF